MQFLLNVLCNLKLSNVWSSKDEPTDSDYGSKKYRLEAVFFICTTLRLKTSTRQFFL